MLQRFYLFFLGRCRAKYRSLSKALNGSAAGLSLLASSVAPSGAQEESSNTPLNKLPLAAKAAAVSP
ncbi:hypothetical protein ALE3EI_0015 [Constantimarinum furrinae]|uniref:Uncharacterized protein n=1 Tax=Constantimarinum furrinae TaxID=2562285 RepID=A0A7G8PQJ0_9FLAO|nr:hypothetical protein ALE3EI_0015 [Constantimarinum furrinae]